MMVKRGASTGEIVDYTKKDDFAEFCSKCGRVYTNSKNDECPNCDKKNDIFSDIDKEEEHELA